MKFAIFSIELDGRTYNATWHIEGGDVVVRSAYGSGRALKGALKAQKVAEKLLLGIVEHWRA